MNPFARCKKIETAAMRDIIPFLRGSGGRFVSTFKGHRAKEIQCTYGDFFYEDCTGNLWAIELKTEERNQYGNFFLETWSNRQWKKLGWLYTLQTDVLLYYFLMDRALYSIDFHRLQSWAFGHCNGGTEMPARLYDFKERPQKKHDQRNDTWGRPVPIKTIKREVGFNFYHLGEEPKPCRPVESAAQMGLPF